MKFSLGSGDAVTRLVFGGAAGRSGLLVVTAGLTMMEGTHADWLYVYHGVTPRAAGNRSSAWRCLHSDCPGSTFTEGHPMTGQAAKFRAGEVDWATGCAATFRHPGFGLGVVTRTESCVAGCGNWSRAAPRRPALTGSKVSPHSTAGLQGAQLGRSWLVCSATDPALHPRRAAASATRSTTSAGHSAQLLPPASNERR